MAVQIMWCIKRLLVREGGDNEPPFWLMQNGAVRGISDSERDARWFFHRISEVRAKYWSFVADEETRGETVYKFKIVRVKITAFSWKDRAQQNMFRIRDLRKGLLEALQEPGHNTILFKRVEKLLEADVASEVRYQEAEAKVISGQAQGRTNGTKAGKAKDVPALLRRDNR